MEIKNFNNLLEKVQKQNTKRVVAINGIDESTIEAMHDAIKRGIISPIITGNKKEIEGTCKKLNINICDYEIHHTESLDASISKAIELIKNKQADFLMKGLLPTNKFMHALLKKEYDLVDKHHTLNHIAVIENPNYHKLLIFSDAAVLPYPDLKQKILMTSYLLNTAQSLGIENPKLAIIAPTEQIIPTISSCTDAAIIAKMAQNNQIKGGIVDGPMALDVAISRKAAETKNISSPVAGNADCLLFPNIDAANVFYKTNTKLAQAELAGIVAGAKIPVVVSSRGDNRKTKLNSLALASILCNM